MKNRSPIFIVGASRSGTTMLRLLLNAHPCIAIPKEFSYFTSIPDSWLSSWQDIPVSVDEYRQVVRNDLFRGEILGEAGADTDALLERVLDASDRRDLSIPYQLMLTAYANAEGKSRWGEKTPMNLFYCDVLHQMFPNARFIHLVRDPRAVVRSANNFPRLPDDTLVNATNWLHFVTNGYERLVRYVPSHQWCTIRYEDITSSPEAVAREICEFVEEPFDERMLDFHKDAESRLPSSADQLGGARKVARPIHEGRQAKWRSDLSDYEVGMVEYVCKDVMPIFGYEPTEIRVQWLDMLKMIYKYTYTCIKRWQNKNTRFHIIRYTPKYKWYKY